MFSKETTGQENENEKTPRHRNNSCEEIASLQIMKLIKKCFWRARYFNFIKVRLYLYLRIYIIFDEFE